MDDQNKLQDEQEQAAELPELEGSVGLGVDIVDIARMKTIIGRTPRFPLRVYTEGERSYCESTASPHVHYATRFAAKEAVLKALGTGFNFGIAPTDVEITRNQYGRPQVQLHRKAAEVAKAQGVREIPVSLSYTHVEAVACAMAITAESVRVAEQRVNPMEELAKQFKDARSLLDDLPVQREDGTREGSLPEMPPVLEAPGQQDEAEGPLFEQTPLSEFPEEDETPDGALDDALNDAQEAEAAEPEEAEAAEASEASEAEEDAREGV